MRVIQEIIHYMTIRDLLTEEQYTIFGKIGLIECRDEDEYDDEWYFEEEPEEEIPPFSEAELIEFDVARSFNKRGRSGRRSRKSKVAVQPIVPLCAKDIEAAESLAGFRQLKISQEGGCWLMALCQASQDAIKKSIA